jgi:DNA (cytosine-5)-methyltransferase 1
MERWREMTLSGEWWAIDPADDGSIPRTAVGIKDRVNRLKALGNGQTALTAATAWKILGEDK